jgi:DNA-directed RNA polymerase specialized sigma24 family protein
MRAAVVPWARALVRLFCCRLQKGWPAAGPGALQKKAVGRHRNRTAVRKAERSGAAPNRSARREAAKQQADEAVSVLYDSHYRALTQLGALLAGDLAAAEDIAQAAFVAMHRAWRLLGTSDAALWYLRREIIRRARSRRPGRRGVARQTRQQWRPPGRTTAVPVLAVLATLPARQREAIILRCWGGLSDTEIAALTGARRRAVTDNLNRGMTVLAAAVSAHSERSG